MSRANTAITSRCNCAAPSARVLRRAGKPRPTCRCCPDRRWVRVRHHPRSTARACGRVRGDGAHARVADAVGPTVPARGSGVRVVRLAGDPPGQQGWRVPMERWAGTTVTQTSISHPMTVSTPRWTGGPSAKGRPKRSSPPNHSPHRSIRLRMALFDLSSSWVTSRCCERTARGEFHDRKRAAADRIRHPQPMRPGVRWRRPGRVREIVEVARTGFGIGMGV